MEKPQGLPLGAIVAGAIQDRQSAEGAKLAALIKIVDRLENLYLGQCRTNEILTELLERTKRP